MMSRIYHYELKQEQARGNTPGDDFLFSVTVPAKAQLLTVATRQGTLVAYYRVDPDTPLLHDEFFYVVPTGAEFNSLSVEYVQTVKLDWLVFHVFRAT